MNDYYSDLDRAQALGRAYAMSGIAAGDTEPEDAPLSGEWAGAPTVDDIVRDLGGDPWGIEPFERDDIGDSWEAGYYSAPWPTFDVIESE